MIESVLHPDDAAFLTSLGRRLEAAQGLPEASTPTCSHRGPDAHCEREANHDGPHRGGGYTWSPAVVPGCCPGCSCPCGQCDRDEEALN